jgi:hypothetical protein
MTNTDITDTTGLREIYKQAAKASRERAVHRLRPGWWVFTCGPLDGLYGTWLHIIATREYRHPDTGELATTLTVAQHAGHDDPGWPWPRDNAITTPSTAIAWCLSPVGALRVGLASTDSTSGKD